MFASYGRAVGNNSLTFVSGASLANGMAERYGLAKPIRRDFIEQNYKFF